MGKALSLCPDT